MLLSLQGTDEDWQYATEPSSTCCLGLKDQMCNNPRGKALGGSSTLNAMMYTRSTRYDHERWSSEGNEGWDFDSIVKYYKEIEHTHIHDNKYYGTNGDLHISQYTATQPIRQILSNAYEELNCQEYNEDKPLGYRDVLLTIQQGTRQSTSKAFLTPIKDRKNLYLTINSHVQKILIDPKTLTAFGVEVQINNEIVRLKSKKETIISAGAFNSPQILMNSGIGPKDYLKEVGIEIIKDLQVGENYQDHVAFPFAVQIDPSAVVSQTFLEVIGELYNFIMNREGKLAEIGLLNFASYINTKNEADFANVQIVNLLIVQNDPYLLHEALRAIRSEELSNTLLDYNKNTSFILFLPFALHPKSSGRIRLQANDPFSAPLITPNYFSDKDGEDIKVLLDTIKYIKTLTETKAFSPYNPKIIDVHMSNCNDFILQFDEYWKCAIRNAAFPVYHPVGTCKMGPSSDPLAVVDPQLRVHGVNRLRVVDASIMPTIPSCNTNAPTIMIGVKGADLITNAWINRHDEL